ncbi:MAG: asparaginase domain-containing protein [Thermodesulfobacteriota bacterium]|nr:asparaginase domain-containing protein [Thermodesulfobacteriota bacterium]
MKIKFYAVGGTIDKIYFDKKSTYEVGKSLLEEILRESNITFEYEIELIIGKDSLDMTEEDRRSLLKKISSDQNQFIVVTHGTDTMIETAKKLKAIENKTIVLTGSMEPARFRSSDAVFNIGGAVAAVQVLKPGVYIVMNGHIFDPEKVRKNIDLNRFEEI